MEGFPKTRATLLLGGLAILLSLVCVLSIGMGAVAIAPTQVVTILAKQIGITLPWSFEIGQEGVLLAIRLPRVVLGILVGAGLATSGAAMQGLFRNPLADPGLIGISSGAAFAAVSVIVLGKMLSEDLIQFFGPFALPVAAFFGGFCTALAVYRLAKVAGRTNVATLLLAGIAINALAGSGMGFLIFMANDVQLRSITFWSMGSLGGATWTTVGAVVPFILTTVLLMPRLSRALNAFLLGEAEAGHLGISVEYVKRTIVLLVALAVGAAVSVSGIIGFVGLVVPHLLRLSLGPDHRYLLPGTALLGASLLVGADLTARLVVAPAELPIGVVTTALGAPFFLWLLLRDRSRGRWLG